LQNSRFKLKVVFKKLQVKSFAQYFSNKKSLLQLTIFAHTAIQPGAAPAQNEGRNKTKKIETYGYNFRGLWHTKCSIIFFYAESLVHSRYNIKKESSFG